MFVLVLRLRLFWLIGLLDILKVICDIIVAQVILFVLLL